MITSVNNSKKQVWVSPPCASAHLWICTKGRTASRLFVFLNRYWRNRLKDVAIKRKLTFRTIHFSPPLIKFCVNIWEFSPENATHQNWVQAHLKARRYLTGATERVSGKCLKTGCELLWDRSLTDSAAGAAPRCARGCTAGKKKKESLDRFRLKWALPSADRCSDSGCWQAPS